MNEGAGVYCCTFAAEPSFLVFRSFSSLSFCCNRCYRGFFYVAHMQHIVANLSKIVMVARRVVGGREMVYIA